MRSHCGILPTITHQKVFRDASEMQRDCGIGERMVSKLQKSLQYSLSKKCNCF